MARRVPFTGDEKESLKAAIERHRDVALWKIEGLDDEQLRRRMTPSGTSLLGLIKHLAWVDYGWFCETFGRPSDNFGIDGDDEDADLRVDADETAEEILTYFAKSRAATNAVIDELPMDAIGTAWFGEQVTLRWVMIHMLEDWARHAGHMDILRELIDGATGDHDRS
jgi:uncharacterized damage-inducible protein DinB